MRFSFTRVLTPQKGQYPLTREHTLNHVWDPYYDLRYIPQLREIELSGALACLASGGAECALAYGQSHTCADGLFVAVNSEYSFRVPENQLNCCWLAHVFVSALLKKAFSMCVLHCLPNPEREKQRERERDMRDVYIYIYICICNLTNFGCVGPDPKFEVYH